MPKRYTHKDFINKLNDVSEEFRNKFSNYRYTPAVVFDGYRECYTNDILKHINI